MSDLFDDTLLPKLLIEEGGDKFTNNPADTGGATKFGITAAKLGEWRKLGRAATVDEVKALQQPEASAIYRNQFWTGPGFDLVNTVSQKLAGELFDCGVNMGPTVPSVWLQRMLNVLNNGGVLWPDLPNTDGHIGPMTMQSLKSLFANRGAHDAEGCLFMAIHAFQTVHYVELSEKGTGRTQNEQFVWGWLKNRVSWA